MTCSYVCCASPVGTAWCWPAVYGHLYNLAICHGKWNRLIPKHQYEVPAVMGFANEWRKKNDKTRFWAPPGSVHSRPFRCMTMASLDVKSLVENNCLSVENVLFSRSFHFCNLLQLCNIRTIPTYRVPLTLWYAWLYHKLHPQINYSLPWPVIRLDSG